MTLQQFIIIFGCIQLVLSQVSLLLRCRAVCHWLLASASTTRPGVACAQARHVLPHPSGTAVHQTQACFFHQYVTALRMHGDSAPNAPPPLPTYSLALVHAVARLLGSCCCVRPKPAPFHTSPPTRPLSTAAAAVPIHPRPAHAQHDQHHLHLRLCHHCHRPLHLQRCVRPPSSCLWPGL